MLRLRAPLLCAALASGAALYGALTAASASAEDCNHPIFDGAGYVYDFEALLLHGPAGPPDLSDAYGVPQEGGSNAPGGSPPGPVETADAWDEWGDVFVYPMGADLLAPTLANKYDGPADACSFALGGQEIQYPVRMLQGLEVQHRWYVDPGPLHGARVLTVLHNPGAAPIEVTVLQGDAAGTDNRADLGSDGLTESHATSDGTGAFSPSSSWGVTSDNELGEADTDPALAHVWDGPSGAMRASEVVLGSPRADSLYWDWHVTVPAGATAAFISYEIEDADPSRLAETEVAQAVAQAEAREQQSPASLYVGMSTEEIAGTMNWPHPTPKAAIAPVANATAPAPVHLDGSGSVGAPGLPQCGITGYSWKTDDGAQGTGPTLTHLFSAGRHQATLTVSNDCGGSDAATIAFDVAAAPPPHPPPPSTTGLELRKVTANKRTGTATITVEAPVPGQLTLVGKGLKRQVREVAQPGLVSLPVKPTARTLKLLAKTGRATVKATVVLTPPGAQASSVSKTLTLKRLR